MPWLCIKEELLAIPWLGISLYTIDVCGAGTDQLWHLSGMPAGDCATASTDPSCFWVDDGNPPARHPDLTPEQNAHIDKISDIIAYKRLNEPDKDEPRLDE